MIRGDGSIEAHPSSIDNQMEVLAPELGRTIVDKTVLTGNYDYTLKWASDKTLEQLVSFGSGISFEGRVGMRLRLCFMSPKSCRRALRKSSRSRH
jgi:uncharacterized protein (TIGR03435 family)